MNKRSYTLGEEIFNAVSHGIGIVLAAAGMTVLIITSAISGDGYALSASIIYGVTLFILYLSSTLYHSMAHEKTKYVFRVLDHCSIFLLIAGTYTPFTLVTLRGTIGYTLFGVIWGISILGIVFNAIDLKKFAKISVVLYLVLGWAIVFAMEPLVNALDLGGIVLLASGGVMYTVGIIFYALKRYKYMHSIWHLFVLTGSVLHYFSIQLYVMPNVF